MPTSDRLALPEAVQRYVAQHLAGAHIAPLAGDASTRRYFRLTLPTTTSGHAGREATGSNSARSGLATCVLAFYGHGFVAADFPFLETTRLFTAIDLPVPRVLDVDPDAGIILLDDLGDDLLQAVVMGRPPVERGDPFAAAVTVAAPSAAPPRELTGSHLRLLPTTGDLDQLYRQAVEHIVRLQRDGTPRLSLALHAGREVLDGDRFRLELEFFLEHLVHGLADVPRKRLADRRIEAAFDALYAILDREPRVLCHRDFHSRNLMVGPPDRLSIVDHQDARRGPDTYDLASLLTDPYVAMPEARATAMLTHYLLLLQSTESLDSLQARFDRVAVQRLLKAAGTFAAQKTLHQRDTYLVYLTPALSRAQTLMQRCDEMAPLHAALAPAFAKLRGVLD